jgi:hypothetical protein
MAIPSILIVIFLFLITALIILRPILVESKEDRGATNEVDALLAEKERLFAAILDLDQAHELKKISDQDYEINRNQLLHQAADLMQKLDQRSQSEKKRESPGVDDGVDNIK